MRRGSRDGGHLLTEDERDLRQLVGDEGVHAAAAVVARPEHAHDGLLALGGGGEVALEDLTAAVQVDGVASGTAAKTKEQSNKIDVMGSPPGPR